ncbi:hypothetical protein C2845_PM13G11970, partial [Panicum miliaceum]
DVKFKVDYIIVASGSEFGRVYLAGDKNIVGLFVTLGVTKVKEQRHKGDTSPYVKKLLRLEEVARDQGLGCWIKEPSSAEASVRILPSSTIGEANPSSTKGFVAKMKGKILEAIVEQVRDGSTIHVYLIPSFTFVQVYVAGAAVWIILEGIDSFDNMFASAYYSGENTAKDVVLELAENVIVAEVIGGGKLYAQIVGDRRLDNIQQELASMKSNEASETLIAKDSSNTLSDTLEVQDINQSILHRIRIMWFLFVLCGLVCLKIK